MAMITCRECAADVSTKAAKCPNCGAPVVTAARRIGRALKFSATALVLTLVALIAWNIGTVINMTR